MENQGNSPVPAWAHYEIVKFAETEVMQELEKEGTGNDAEDFLAGLAVGYLHIPEGGIGSQNYSISFGYHVECEERSVEDEIWSDPPPGQLKKDPIDDNFIDTLFEQVRNKILESAPDNSGEYLVSLEITVGHCSKFKVVCRGRRCRPCNTHGENIQRRRNKTPTSCEWVCTGNPCPA